MRTDPTLRAIGQVDDIDSMIVSSGSDQHRRLVIVVTNWRQEETTLACLQQLQLESPVGTSVLLVDNEGDGATTAVFEAHRELFDHYHKFPENVGFTGASNYGLAFAKRMGYPFILWLNNDAQLDARCVERLLEELETDRTLAMVGPVLRTSDTGVPHFCGAKLEGSIPALRYHALIDVEACSPDDCLLYGTALMARTELVDRVGGFCEEYFAYWEDMELSVRLLESGFKCRIVPGATVIHDNQRADEVNTVRSRYYYYYMTRNEIRFWRRASRGRARLRALRWQLLRSCERIRRLRRHGHRIEALAILHGLLDGYRGRFGRWSRHPTANP